MRNRMLQLAGVLALLAMIGKFYAVPAIAQVVRAALVQNRDEPGRSPYFVSSSGASAGGPSIIVNFEAVPAGKRLIIQSVSASIAIYSQGDELTEIEIGRQVGSSYLRKAYLRLPTLAPVLGPPLGLNPNPRHQHYLNEMVLVTLEAGEAPYLFVSTDAVTTPNASVYLAGYLIDIP